MKQRTESPDMWLKIPVNQYDKDQQLNGKMYKKDIISHCRFLNIWKDAHLHLQ